MNPYDDYGDGWAFDQVWVDLFEHRVDFEQPAGAPDITLAGFERVAAGGLRVNLQGDRNANELVSTGCRTTIAGAAGDDLLRVYGDDLLCAPHHAVVRGGPGRDRLTGGEGNDRLLGGPGRDVASGRHGTDTCQTEVRHSCERT